MKLKFISIMLICFLFSISAKTEEYNEYQKVSNIIYDLIINETPNHPLALKPQKRYKLAVNIVEASNNADIPWEYTIPVIKYESGFRHNKISKDGYSSIGYMQIHGAAITYCKEKENRKVRVKKNPKDQLICGAHWLKYSIDQCDGSLEQGLARYATGYMCKYKHSKSIRFIVGRRMKIYKRIVKNETAKI